MEVSRKDLDERYASLSDDELLAIDPNELTDVAQQCCRREIERRHLSEEMVAEETVPDDAESELDFDDEPTDWLDTAAIACSFQAGAGRQYAEDAQQACIVLHQAGIPSEVVGEHQEGRPDSLNVMVPDALSLKAISILDRDLFNEELEETWRAHFEQLSDSDLRAMDADDLCAGLLDRAARLKRVYEEALLRRRVKPSERGTSA